MDRRGLRGARPLTPVEKLADAFLKTFARIYLALPDHEHLPTQLQKLGHGSHGRVLGYASAWVSSSHDSSSDGGIAYSVDIGNGRLPANSDTSSGSAPGSIGTATLEDRLGV